jgi:hypothetical protein
MPHEPVMDTHNVPQRYSRRTFGIQAYFQLCIPDSLWVDSLIESRLEESVASYFEDKGQLVGWI